MYRQQPPALVGMKLGGMLTQGTGEAGAYVALFFRLAKLACRTSLASFCPASRNAKSIAPNSWASGTSTARSTIWRTVCSILGRSCFMMASMRCSRVSLTSAEGEGMDMVQLLVGGGRGYFSSALQPTTPTCRFPTQVTAARPPEERPRETFWPDLSELVRCSPAVIEEYTQSLSPTRSYSR